MVAKGHDDSSLDRLADDTGTRTLYLSEHGSVLSWTRGRFRLELPTSRVVRIPSNQVRRIVLLANVAITTPCMSQCLKRQVPIVFASGGGKAAGLLHPWPAKWQTLRRAQVMAGEEADARVSLGRVLVGAKVRNAATVLSRAARHRELPDLARGAQQLRQYRARIAAASTLEQLLGYEGNAARCMFGAMARAVAPAWGFKRRERRPPTDPINALLSFGYSLLYNHMATALTAHGFLIAQGFLHSPRSGHAALASDLMEEFRAPVVDALVLKLVLGAKIQPEQFPREEGTGGAVRIPTDVRRAFIVAFEKKLATAIYHRRSGCRLDYLRAFDWQCTELRRWLLGEQPEYNAFTLR